MVVFDYRRKPWKEVLDFIKNIKGRTLDLGCGNGNILRLLKNGVGLDISYELLKKAKNPVVQGRCENLPFKDRSFENVLLIAVLHNLKKNNRINCLKEIRRVLKKKLFLSVWCKYEGTKYIKWGKVKRYYYFFREGELRKLLERIGFRILNFKRSGDNYFVEAE